MATSLQARSNIAHKVRNTKLPRTKALMPLFEVISNSIHAISEAKLLGMLAESGKISVKIIRNGDQATLEGMKQIDSYPIKSFVVTDNGIGFNNNNLEFFVESDTDHKMDIGGKGIGRFVCLKAFKKMVVKSYFKANSSVYLREFEFHASKENFRNLIEEENPEFEIGTTITLSEYKDEFIKFVPRPIMLVARAIVLHFQLYFIQDTAPEIIVENQNGDFINVKRLFHAEFKNSVKEKEFKVYDSSFTLYLTKLYNGLSHKIHFCAHNRSVKEEGLASRIVDLGKYPIQDDNGDFYYQAFVVGDILDENVDTERVGFTFATDDDDESEEEDSSEITLFKVRRGAVAAIEELLAEYLDMVRDEKIKVYTPTIHDELPQYRTILESRIEEVKKLPPKLSNQKLDIELYKIEANWKIEIKEEGKQLLDSKKDIQSLDAYKDRYEKFLQEFNEIGKIELARYVVHRKAVIELLELLLGKNSDDKFTNEDIIHSIFFPLRSSSDDVPHDKQNLWLLDERLTYHSFLASDKRFEQISHLSSNGQDRTDLLIFNDALAFSENKLPPYNSFTIVEFKKPQRDDFQDNDPKKNPLDQVEKYIDDLLEGHVTNRQGRQIKIDRSTPFYVYIVCDISNSFERILQKREFIRTPDGMGYYRFKSQYYSAYIEILPFEKLLLNANQRNRILFNKLGIDY